MSQELLFLLITILAFGAVAIGVFAIGQFIAVQIRVHQRVAAQGRDVETAPDIASPFLTCSISWSCVSTPALASKEHWTASVARSRGRTAILAPTCRSWAPRDALGAAPSMH